MALLYDFLEISAYCKVTSVNDHTVRKPKTNLRSAGRTFMSNKLN
jgi:hypothetical protein